MMLRRILAITAIGVGLLVGAVPADAGIGTTLESGIAKKQSGPYLHILERELAPGRAKDFPIRVINMSGVTQDARLFAVLNVNPRYKAKFFKGDHNITDAVSSSGFSFELGGLQAKQFRLRVKVTDTGGMLAPYCISSLFDIGAGTETSANLSLNGVCG